MSRPAASGGATRPAASGGAPPRVGALRPAGDRALVVDVDDTAQAALLAARMSAHPLPGQRDAVCGARSVLLVLDRRPDPALVTARVDELLQEAGAGEAARAGAEHVVEVLYDGEDLDEVAAATGLGRDGVVAAHTSAPWTVGFGGFAPGFAYLVGGDPALEVPRRSSSRPRVPAGAVGLAGHHSGIYPRSSPGGWQLIGRSAARLWDAERTPPALLAPGDTVRFTAVERLSQAAPEAGEEAPGEVVDETSSEVGDAGDPRAGAAGGPRAGAVPDGAPGSSGEGSSFDGAAVEVAAVGLQAVVVDAGRPGRAGAGVPASGPMDRGALVAANTAAGNPAWTAALEVVGGLRLVARGEVVVAVAGAPAGLTATSRDGVRRRREHGAALALRDGEALELGQPASGLRSYVAVRGGLDVAPVLGSRCTDTLSGLGPEALAVGDVLAVGAGDVVAVGARGVTAPDGRGAPASALRQAGPEPGGAGEDQGPTVLAVVLGPRDDWFTPSALAGLVDQDWTVGARSDRVGLRLSAERPLERSRGGELPTEGVAAGSLQASPDGDLVLFAADHPVTGGYPVVAVVVDAHLDRVGQLRPGDRLRFTVDEES